MAFKFQLGAARMSGSLTQEEGITVDSGGLTVTAGGATITAGGLTVSAGTTAVAALTATTLSGSGAISTLSTLACDGAATLNAGLTVSAGTTAMQAATCTSLSAGDGNITNVGSIACDTVTVDAASAGLDISFGGVTTKNLISLQDNLADALTIKQGANSYMKFTTTDSSELITFGKGLTAASQTWTDLGAVTTCDINGGTVGGVTLDGTLAGTPNFTGIVTHAATEIYNNGLSVKNGDTSAGFIKFFEDSDNGSNAITLAGASSTGDINLTLPAVAGTLVTDAGMGGNIDIGAYSLTALTLVSDATTGTAPLTVASTTVVANLNSSTLGGATFAAPGAIGGTTAAAITGTIITAKTSVRPDTLGGADLGEDGIGWGDVYIADDKKIKFGNGNDATIEYDENGTDELRFAGAAVTFEQAVTFDGAVTLGESTADSITVLGNSTFENTTVGGLTTLNGSTDVGDAVGDTCTFTARIDSDFVPSSDSARNLGTSGLRWSTIYVDSIVGANVAWDVESRAAGQTISADTDFCLVTSANGGTVTMPAASAGKVVRVKLSASVGDLVLSAGTNDTIESSGSIRLESTGSAVILVSYDATNWFVM